MTHLCRRRRGLITRRLAAKLAYHVFTMFPRVEHGVDHALISGRWQIEIKEPGLNLLFKGTKCRPAHVDMKKIEQLA